ncbi:MAG: paraquat-inducible protein A [Aquirhabdus sp.]
MNILEIFKSLLNKNKQTIIDQVNDEHLHLSTAKDLSLIVCHSCGLLNPNPSQASLEHKQTCSRCHSILHERKPASLERTWALMLAAAILYIPANLLPMTISSTLVTEQRDTIMSGVIYFWHNHDYFVAFVIFIASIFIPILKLMILTFLLLVVQKQSTDTTRWEPQHCALLYRVVEFVGRWSMIDVFVVSLLTALIQMQALASMTAGLGVVAFGAVVVLTMLAALSFDPRMIWDNYYNKPVNQGNTPQAMIDKADVKK